jgi:hypothetical protein
MASETPGYLRIMRIPSFTSSEENAGFHRLAVIARRLRSSLMDLRAQRILYFCATNEIVPSRVSVSTIRPDRS